MANGGTIHDGTWFRDHISIWLSLAYCGFSSKDGQSHVETLLRSPLMPYANVPSTCAIPINPIMSSGETIMVRDLDLVNLTVMISGGAIWQKSSIEEARARLSDHSYCSNAPCRVSNGFHSKCPREIFLNLFFICFPLVSHSGSGWSHEFLHLFPIYSLFICFPLVSHFGSGWSHDFLHLSSISFSFVFHLFPTLGPVVRMISFTCLPFVFHLFPTCLPILGVVGRMISLTCFPCVFHLIPTCFLFWVW